MVSMPCIHAGRSLLTLHFVLSNQTAPLLLQGLPLDAAPAAPDAGRGGAADLAQADAAAVDAARPAERARCAAKAQAQVWLGCAVRLCKTYKRGSLLRRSWY